MNAYLLLFLMLVAFCCTVAAWVHDANEKQRVIQELNDQIGTFQTRLKRQAESIVSFQKVNSTISDDLKNAENDWFNSKTEAAKVRQQLDQHTQTIAAIHKSCERLMRISA